MKSLAQQWMFTGNLDVVFLSQFTSRHLKLNWVEGACPLSLQKQLTILYKGHPLKKKYVADLICFDQIIVELKACERLTGIDEGQLLNYMRMARMHVGLLINFGSRVRLEWKRYVL